MLLPKNDKIVDLDFVRLHARKTSFGKVQDFRESPLFGLCSATTSACIFSAFEVKTELKKVVHVHANKTEMKKVD